ncbi:hypothetical protein YC2023_031360 [Brassica napus]
MNWLIVQDHALGSYMRIRVEIAREKRESAVNRKGEERSRRNRKGFLGNLSEFPRKSLIQFSRNIWRLGLPG